MSTFLLPIDGWSRRRWAAVVALVFGLHVGLILMLEDRVPVTLRGREPRLAVGLVLDPATSQRLLDTLGIGDPTVLPLGNPRGGVAPAWRGYSPVEQRLQAGDTPVAAVAQSVSRLGGVFEEFVQTNAASPAPVPDRPAVQPVLPVKSAVSPPGRSTLRVQGVLAARPLIEPTLPRSWQHTNLLAETTVELFVNAAGEVLSPRLSSGGGAKDSVQRAADQHALDLARSLRFQPLANAPLTPGAIVFHWHVAAPAPKP